MARPLRPHFPGAIYHVTARGNDRRLIFEDDDDCASFLVVLARTVARYRLLCHAYCLMGNHYHLLLQTPEANLSIAMRQLNGVYGQRFNRRHERCGHVLQGRFGAELIDGETYLREVCRYIVLNPVRAALVGHPAEWKWSSYRATAGEAIVPGFLTVDWVRGLSGAKTSAEAVKRYVSFIAAGVEGPEIPLEQFRSNATGGAGESTAAVRDDRDDAKQCREFPRTQRSSSRPALEHLFSGVASRADRNARSVVAVRNYGYTMKEVGDFLGRHYVTVSRALAQSESVAPKNVGM
jgi:putative transposase